MWEHFTTKPYLSELRFIGHVPTPWASWMIVASPSLVSARGEQLTQFLRDLTRSVHAFDDAQAREGVSKEFVMRQFGYPEEDVVAWLEGVRYPKEGLERVEKSTVEKTLRCVVACLKLSAAADFELALGRAARSSKLAYWRSRSTDGDWRTSSRRVSPTWCKALYANLHTSRRPLGSSAELPSGESRPSFGKRSR